MASELDGELGEEGVIEVFVRAVEHLGDYKALDGVVDDLWFESWLRQR